MALTDLQRAVCRVIAENRIAAGESYVAGGAALNTVIDAPRTSRDIDIFHDTDEALRTCWDADKRLLETSGFEVRPLRERPTFVEAEVSRTGESVLVEWMRDSAFRFFPLQRHADLGLTLHPYDLATNKLLALAGRLEVRDWVDLVNCNERIQPLGFLAWGACGKDAGFSPRGLLEHARRSGHYTSEEISELSFAGPPPDAQEMAREWRRMLAEADEIVSALPPEEAGTCVIDERGRLFQGSAGETQMALSDGRLRFHRGRVGGVLPTVKS